VGQNLHKNVELSSWKLEEYRQIRRYQDDGYLVLAGGQEFPGPRLYDVPELKYEYGSHKCPWGTIRKVQGRWYVLSINGNDKELPPEIARWVGKTLQLAVVTVDAARRQATVQVEEDGTGVLLTNVATWQSPWSLLDAVNKTLREQGLAIVCRRLEWTEEEEGNDIPDQLWPPGTEVPRARNDHTAAHLTGYAHDNGILVYLGAVGHKTSLKSIWASAVKGGKKRRVHLSLGRYQPTERLSDYHKPLYAPLPDQFAHHLVLLGRAATEAQMEDGVGITYLLVWAGDDDPQASSRRLLVERLNAALPIPILPEWADALWQAAESRRWLAKIATGGDCRAGHRLTINAEIWINLVRELVDQEALTF
jgi:hypothetical protein